MEAAVEFLWWWMGGWWVVGVQSHFHVQPNYSVEVVLCCRWGCDNNNSNISLTNISFKKSNNYDDIERGTCASP